MLTLLYQYVRKNTNAVSLVVLAVLFGGCAVGFHFRGEQLGQPPDIHFFVTAELINEFLSQPNNPDGRYLYAATQATLDVIFPITYCTLLGVIIAQLFSQKMATRLLIFPLLAFIFDLSENTVLIYLAMLYEQEMNPLEVPWLAIVLTPTKWLFIAASGLAIITGLVGKLAVRKKMT